MGRQTRRVLPAALRDGQPRPFDEEFAVAPPHSGWAHDPALEAEAAAVAEPLGRLKAAYDAGELSAVAFVGAYVLIYVQARHKHWLCGRRQRPIAPDDGPAAGPADETRVLGLPEWAVGAKARQKLQRHEAEPGAGPVTVGRLFGEWQLQGVPHFAAACIAQVVVPSALSRACLLFLSFLSA